MSHTTRVQAIDCDGRVSFISQEDALAYVKAGDAKPTQGFTIYLKTPLLRGLRGPSCSVSGHTHGLGMDGRPKFSTVERYAHGHLIRAQNKMRDLATNEPIYRGQVVHDYAGELRELKLLQMRALAECGAKIRVVSQPKRKPPRRK